MQRMSRKTKRGLMKFAAGLAAVLISPPLSVLVGRSSDAITEVWRQAWEREAVAVEARISQNSQNLYTPTLKMNSSALLLYSPSGTGQVVTREILPPPPPESAEDLPLFPEEAGFDEPVAQVLSQNITDIREDAVEFVEVDGRIVKMTFSSSGGSEFFSLDKAGQVRNTTSHTNDFLTEQSRILPDIRLESGGEPEVLIMHTHTTEAFQPMEYDYFDSSYIGRSLDSSRNIVAVGAEIAMSFAEAGITVIHDGTVHDYPQFNGAYTRSADTVKQILAAYPSIKIVLDIHRDAIERGDGSRVAPVTEVDGRSAAQVMLISAADDGTYDMPHYMENFKLASLLQQHMEYDNPGITRPVWFQYCRYNQHLTTGSLLVEVGSHGNTLEEAKYAGRLIGKSMAEALLSL